MNFQILVKCTRINEILDIIKSNSNSNSQLDKIEIREHYISLFMDIFSIHNYNSLLGQLTLLLICRYYSETSEFIRNIDRMVVLFDDSEHRMHQYIANEIEQFIFFSEKSNLRFMNISSKLEENIPIDNIEVFDEVSSLERVLNNLKTVIVRNCNIAQTKDGKLILEYNGVEKRINADMQNLFRNLKVYDYLIDFLYTNKEFLIKIRSFNYDAEAKQHEGIAIIRKTFKRIFKILEYMTKENPETQELMWKYKEEFTMKELGDIQQEGELKLVLAIIDDSPESVKLNQNKWNITREKYFVNCLRSRIKNTENFTILLEIFNKLIKFDAFAFIRQPLTKLIINSPEYIVTFDQKNEKDFIRALNTQEIIYNLILNQNMKYMRMFIKSYFHFNEMLSILDKSISKIDELEINSAKMGFQELEELKDTQYINLINIYIQVYLNSKYSDSDKETIAKEFTDKIAPQYIEMLNSFNSSTDFKELGTLNKSKLRFLMIYMQYFILNLKSYLNMSDENNTHSNFSRGDTGVEFPSQVVRMRANQMVKLKLESVDEAYSDIFNKLKTTDNKEIEEEIKIITSIRESTDNNLRIDKTIKSRSSRSEESGFFNNIWKDNIKSIVVSRSSRLIVDKENATLVDLVFDTITNEDSKQQIVESFKRFISTSIKFICLTEITNWSLYIIIFVFKINSMLLITCNKNLTENNNIDESKISEVVDCIDTLKISNMIFKILSTSRTGRSEYSNEVYSITAYFTCKLLSVRPKSTQKNFLQFFQDDSISQNFFKQCFEYIKFHKDKLSSGVLKDFYSQKHYTDELSQNCYKVDKNLEKQIVSMLKLLCSNDNLDMQNYMRFQDKSVKSYNLVTLISDYTYEFRKYLQYPVAFDTFISCMDALLEFIQGPNYSNQEILIQRSFVDLSNRILMMEYIETDQMEKKTNDRIVESNYNTRKVFSLNRGLSLKQIFSQALESDAYSEGNEISQPATNFMISLAKFKCLTVLLQMLVGRTKISYVYYLFRRVFSPEMFRLNFAYISDFIYHYHDKEYLMDLFFKYNKDIDDHKESPLIIEVGFRLYFLLMRMKDNLQNDMDEKYLKRILCLLSERTKASSTIKKGIIIEIEDICKDIFELSTICCKKTMKNVVRSRVNSIKEDDMHMRKIIKFFADHSSQIEVLKDDILLTQYFPILPYCKFSSEEPKDRFFQNVNRTNSKTKCEYLIRESPYLIIDLKVNYWLTKQRNKFVQLFQKNIDLWKDLLIYFSILLNGIILASYNSENGSRIYDPRLGNLNESQTRAMMYIFGSITLFFIVNILVNILATDIPIKLKKHRNEIEERNQKLRESGQYYNKNEIRVVVDQLKYAVAFIFKTATDIRLLYFIGLFILTLLGLAVDPFYYTYLVSYLIYKSQTLMSVLQAVWIPRYAIGLTIALMFFVTYILTVFSYTYYASDYPDNTCYSLWSCFVISYDQTFKTGSGIGGYLSTAYSVNGNKENIRYGRVIYDNIQYLVIYVLLINIITGIIIDTFGDLRQKNNEREVDSNSSCFICERSREELEKEYGINGFHTHISTQHNLWDYLFFIAYLRTKMKTGKQLNTLEMYVFEKIEADDQTWLPCYA